MSFSCKRCLQKYIAPGFHCKNCDMYHYASNLGCSIRLGLYKIIWDWGELYTIAFIYKNDKSTMTSTVKLPLLAYNITLDKLKNYLLFV